jgi:BirA family biotin operon repressor/biotin-[acetyl-CoA-carboxylase] ligase
MGPYPKHVTNDDFLDALTPLLCGRFGTPLRHLENIDSTNAEALRWAAEGAPEGAVVVADDQSAGRGRWGRTWESTAGSSLLCSLVLRPQLPPEGIDLVTTMIGVATVEALREVARIEARLKWPNDVLVEDRKLAGILVESQSAPAVSDKARLPDDAGVAVAGIGVNLDLRDAFLIPEVAARAVSLAELVAEPPHRVEVLGALLSWIEPLYGSLAGESGRSALVARASELSAVLGADVSVRFVDGSNATGTARRIMPDGSLEIDLPGGPKSLRTGEIEFLRRAPN